MKRFAAAVLAIFLLGYLFCLFTGYRLPLSLFTATRDIPIYGVETASTPGRTHVETLRKGARCRVFREIWKDFPTFQVRCNGVTGWVEDFEAFDPPLRD